MFVYSRKPTRWHTYAREHVQQNEIKCISACLLVVGKNEYHAMKRVTYKMQYYAFIIPLGYLDGFWYVGHESRAFRCSLHHVP